MQGDLVHQSLEQELGRRASAPGERHVLSAPWGAVVWLTSVISMAAVEALFPQIYGGSLWVIIIELTLLGMYLSLALLAAREHPP